MSFKSNIGKPAEKVRDDQCEMVDAHHLDCTCASCKMMVDVQCLEPAVGTVPECGGVRVCGACAVAMEREEFAVSYLPQTQFVVAHPELGVYIGSGLGFWSKLDPVGQSAAITFPDRATADRLMTAWDQGRPSDAVIWPVVPDLATPGSPLVRASVAACVAAGLEAWNHEVSGVTASASSQGRDARSAT